MTHPSQALVSVLSPSALHAGSTAQTTLSHGKLEQAPSTWIPATPLMPPVGLSAAPVTI